jgi:probable rRNA maturation factor
VISAELYKNRREKEAVLKEKQKSKKLNKLPNTFVHTDIVSESILRCSYIPPKVRKETQHFLNMLENNGIFLDTFKKYSKDLSYFEINFLTSEEIQNLNLQFRNIDSPTDVLSFDAKYIGEIDLCLDVISINAKDLNIDFHQELYRCIIHGILHILGFDHISKLTDQTLHEEPMFLLQEEILKNVTSSSL